LTPPAQDQIGADLEKFAASAKRNPNYLDAPAMFFFNDKNAKDLRFFGF